MKAVIAAMITCAVIFGLSAGATKYLMTQQADPTDVPAEGDASADPAAPEQDNPVDDQSMPVSFRPDANVSVEAVLQMSDSIKRMEQSLAEREKKVQQDEKRVSLLFDDLATEQDELRAYSEGIDTKLELVGRMTQELKTTLAELEQKKTEVEKIEQKLAVQQAEPVNEAEDQADAVKSWFQNLAPEQAADYLREFSNQGKLDLAASLLQRMPDRQKSKILEAMSDPVLVDQLIESLTKKKP